MKVIHFRSLKYIPASHEDAVKPNALKKILFFRDDLDKGRIQMINWVTLLPGKAFRAHYHEDMNEVYILLNGKAHITVGDTQADLSAGDAVLIPQGNVHSMENMTDKEMQYIAIGIATGDKGKTVLV